MPFCFLFTGTRTFPPSSGLTLSCWFLVSKFGLAHNHPLRFLTIVRHMSRTEQEFVCFSVSFFPQDLSLVISTEEVEFQPLGKALFSQAAVLCPLIIWNFSLINFLFFKVPRILMRFLFSFPLASSCDCNSWPCLIFKFAVGIVNYCNILRKIFECHLYCGVQLRRLGLNQSVLCDTRQVWRVGLTIWGVI